MTTWRKAASEPVPLALEVRPSPGDKPCVESAEDSWPLRWGVILVAAAGLGLALLL